MGWTPWSAADAPVGLLALCMMLIPLARQRDEGVPRGPGVRPTICTVSVAARFFMKFCGPKAHPNRHRVSGAVCRKLAVCPRVCPAEYAARSLCPQTVKHPAPPEQPPAL